MGVFIFLKYATIFPSIGELMQLTYSFTSIMHFMEVEAWNLELLNFGITFLMSISKNVFLKFLRNCFFPELLPFIYISLRFLGNFEEQLRKNQCR